MVFVGPTTTSTCVTAANAPSAIGGAPSVCIPVVSSGMAAPPARPRWVPVEKDFRTSNGALWSFVTTSYQTVTLKTRGTVTMPVYSSLGAGQYGRVFEVRRADGGASARGSAQSEYCSHNTGTLCGRRNNSGTCQPHGDVGSSSSSSSSGVTNRNDENRHDSTTGNPKIQQSFGQRPLADIHVHRRCSCYCHNNGNGETVGGDDAHLSSLTSQPENVSAPPALRRSREGRRAAAAGRCEVPVAEEKVAAAERAGTNNASMQRGVTVGNQALEMLACEPAANSASVGTAKGRRSESTAAAAATEKRESGQETVARNKTAGKNLESSEAGGKATEAGTHERMGPAASATTRAATAAGVVTWKAAPRRSASERLLATCVAAGPTDRSDKKRSPRNSAKSGSVGGHTNSAAAVTEREDSCNHLELGPPECSREKAALLPCNYRESHFSCEYSKRCGDRATTAAAGGAVPVAGRAEKEKEEDKKNEKARAAKSRRLSQGGGRGGAAAAPKVVHHSPHAAATALKEKESANAGTRSKQKTISKGSFREEMTDISRNICCRCRVQQVLDKRAEERTCDLLCVTDEKTENSDTEKRRDRGAREEVVEPAPAPALGKKQRAASFGSTRTGGKEARSEQGREGNKKDNGEGVMSMLKHKNVSACIEGRDGNSYYSEMNANETAASGSSIVDPKCPHRKVMTKRSLVKRDAAASLLCSSNSTDTHKEAVAASGSSNNNYRNSSKKSSSPKIEYPRMLVDSCCNPTDTAPKSSTSSTNTESNSTSASSAYVSSSSSSSSSRSQPRSSSGGSRNRVTNNKDINGECSNSTSRSSKSSGDSSSISTSRSSRANAVRRVVEAAPLTPPEADESRYAAKLFLLADYETDGITADVLRELSFYNAFSSSSTSQSFSTSSSYSNTASACTCSCVPSAPSSVPSSTNSSALLPPSACPSSAVSAPCSSSALSYSSLPPPATTTTTTTSLSSSSASSSLCTHCCSKPPASFPNFPACFGCLACLEVSPEFAEGYLNGVRYCSVIVVEKCKADLATFVKGLWAQERMNISALKFYVWQLLNGVAKLHNQNIAHRDLKPENLLVAAANTSNGQQLYDGGVAVVKIADLGMGRKVRWELSQQAAGSSSQVFAAKQQSAGFLERGSATSASMGMTSSAAAGATGGPAAAAATSASSCVPSASSAPAKKTGSNSSTSNLPSVQRPLRPPLSEEKLIEAADRMRQSGHVITLPYRPPELLITDPSRQNSARCPIAEYGLSCDLWSLGVIILEMCLPQHIPRPPYRWQYAFVVHDARKASYQMEVMILENIFKVTGRPSSEELALITREAGAQQAEGLHAFLSAFPQLNTNSRKLSINDFILNRGGLQLDELGLDMLARLLHISPTKRLSAQCALAHPWFHDLPYQDMNKLGLVSHLAELASPQLRRALPTAVRHCVMWWESTGRSVLHTQFAMHGLLHYMLLEEQRTRLKAAARQEHTSPHRSTHQHHCATDDLQQRQEEISWQQSGIKRETIKQNAEKRERREDNHQHRQVIKRYQPQPHQCLQQEQQQQQSRQQPQQSQRQRHHSQQQQQEVQHVEPKMLANASRKHEVEYRKTITEDLQCKDERQQVPLSSACTSTQQQHQNGQVNTTLVRNEEQRQHSHAITDFSYQSHRELSDPRNPLFSHGQQKQRRLCRSSSMRDFFLQKKEDLYDSRKLRQLQQQHSNVVSVDVKETMHPQQQKQRSLVETTAASQNKRNRVRILDKQHQQQDDSTWPHGGPAEASSLLQQLPIQTEIETGHRTAQCQLCSGETTCTADSHSCQQNGRCVALRDEVSIEKTVVSESDGARDAKAGGMLDTTARGKNDVNSVVSTYREKLDAKITESVASGCTPGEKHKSLQPCAAPPLKQLSPDSKTARKASANADDVNIVCTDPLNDSSKEVPSNQKKRHRTDSPDFSVASDKLRAVLSSHSCSDTPRSTQAMHQRLSVRVHDSNNGDHARPHSFSPASVRAPAALQPSKESGDVHTMHTVHVLQQQQHRIVHPTGSESDDELVRSGHYNGHSPLCKMQTACCASTSSLDLPLLSSPKPPAKAVQLGDSFDGVNVPTADGRACATHNADGCSDTFHCRRILPSKSACHLARCAHHSEGLKQLNSTVDSMLPKHHNCVQRATASCCTAAPAICGCPTSSASRPVDHDSASSCHSRDFPESCGCSNLLPSCSDGAAVTSGRGCLRITNVAPDTSAAV